MHLHDLIRQAIEMAEADNRVPDSPDLQPVIDKLREADEEHKKARPELRA